MTHDIKCPIVAPSLAFDNDRVCQCELIKVVRSHERMKIFANLEGPADRDHTDYCRDLTCGGCVELKETE